MSPHTETVPTITFHKARDRALGFRFVIITPASKTPIAEKAMLTVPLIKLGKQILRLINFTNRRHYFYLANAADCLYCVSIYLGVKVQYGICPKKYKNPAIVFNMNTLFFTSLFNVSSMSFTEALVSSELSPSKAFSPRLFLFASIFLRAYALGNCFGNSIIINPRKIRIVPNSNHPIHQAPNHLGS